MGPYRWGGLIQDYIFPLDVLTLGLKKIKELGYLGLEFSGKEAEEMGLVYKAVPADRLEEEVQLLAKRIALQPLDALRGPSQGAAEIGQGCLTALTGRP